MKNLYILQLDIYASLINRESVALTITRFKWFLHNAREKLGLYKIELNLTERTRLLEVTNNRDIYLIQLHF